MSEVIGGDVNDLKCEFSSLAYVSNDTHRHHTSVWWPFQTSYKTIFWFFLYCFLKTADVLAKLQYILTKTLPYN